MSSIDDRIVGMKFNNSQFQKGISETTKSLADLKDKLNLSGAANGLNNLSAASKNFSLDQMGAGIDGLSVKFGALQTMGVAALATLASKAASVGMGLVQSSMASVKEGFSDYNTKLTSVQTIMNATGASIETVSGYFDQLDEYADKTIYNLSDMTGAFAKFTNAGLDMDKSVPAIKGIANMVALAGQDANAASIAMYNLSQSIAGGYLTTTDYKSLNLANVATKEWKDQMVAAGVAAGTLEDLGGGAYHVVGMKAGTANDAAGLFNDNLAEGWATTEVMTKVLGDYGDVNTEIGRKALAAAQDVKSFGMMMETVSAGVATGWTDTFELLLGNVTEAKALFTPLTIAVSEFSAEMSNARNAKLGEWKELGGRTVLIEGLHNVFKALMQIIEPISEAFRNIFPAQTGKQLYALTVMFRDFTAGLIISDGASARLKDVFTALFKVIKFGIDIISGVFRVIMTLVGVVLKLAGALIALTAPIIDFFRGLNEGAAKADTGVSGFFDTIVSFLNQGIAPLIAMMGTLNKSFDDLINTNPEKITSKFESAFTFLATVGENIKKAWGGAGDFASDAWTFIKNIASEVGKVLTMLGDGLKDGMKGVDFNTILAAINTGIFFVIIKTIKKYIDSGSDILSGLGDMFGGVTGVLKSMQNDIKAGMLIKIAVAIGLLSASIYTLSLINPDSLGGALVGVAALIATLVGALVAMDKLDTEAALSQVAALILIAIALNIAATAMVKIASLDWNELARGLTGMAVVIGLLIITMSVLDAAQTEIMDGAKALIVMSVAILILASAVKLFSMMSWEELGKGAAAMATVLGLVVGALMLLSIRSKEIEGAASAILIVSVAIGILVGAIALLGLIPFPVLLQGMATLSIILSLLAGAILLLSVNNKATMAAAAAMLSMAVSINILVGAVVALGMMPMDVLIQGISALAAVMLILVVAMNGMKLAATGAAAMIIVSGAVLALAFAINILGNMPIDKLIIGLVAIAAVFVVLGLAALILAPLTPVVLALAGSLALMGLGLVLMAGSIMVFALGLALLGPGLIIAAGGLRVMAKAIIEVSNAIPAFLGVAAGLLLFGIGAAVAGAGILILAAGLVLLGLGLSIIGAMGLIGVTALAAVVTGIVALMGQIGPILAMGAAFVVLGAGLVIVGAGLVLVGAGLLMAGLGFLLFSVGALAVVAVGPALIVFFTAMIGLIPLLMTSIGTGLIALATTIGEGGPAIVNAVVNIVLAIIDGITTTIPAVVAAAVLLVTNLADAIVYTVPYLVDAGMKMIIGILEGIANNIGKVVDAASSIIVNFIDGISRNLPKVIASGINLIVTFVESLADGIRKNSARMNKAGGELASAIIDGMTGGIAAGGKAVINAAQKMAGGALSGVKNFLGIASPSKEFFKLGGFSSMGMANGLTKYAGRVAQASIGLGKTALDSMKNTMSGLSSAIASDVQTIPVIRPVLDLSAIKKDGSLISGMIDTPELALSGNYASASAISVGQRDATGAASAEAARTTATEKTAPVSFIQNNYSPKALTNIEIYRQTKNLVSEKG